MTEKFEKFSKALDELIREGDMLHMSMQYIFMPEKFKRAAEEKFEDPEKTKKYLDDLPDFYTSYQSWYSEAQSLISQILPNRLTDFQNYYEYPRVRKETTFQNYMIKDMLQGLRVTRYGNEVVADGSSAIPEFVQQLNIVKAAREKLNSTLIDLTNLLQADVFDSEIDSAQALAKSGFLRAAGAICGVIIEKHLQSVAKQRKISIKKKSPTIADLNEALKAAEVISVPQWRFIQHLADIRNLCGHAKGSEPTVDDINDLVLGTNKIIKNIF